MSHNARGVGSNGVGVVLQQVG